MLDLPTLIWYQQWLSFCHRVESKSGSKFWLKKISEMAMNALAKVDEEEDNVVPFPRVGLATKPKELPSLIYMVVSVDELDGSRVNEVPFSDLKDAIEYVEGKHFQYKISYEIEEHILDFTKQIS